MTQRKKRHKMPTVLLISGWRIFFYSNEDGEPMHVLARKGEMECKFWLKEVTYDIEEAWSNYLNPAARRDIRKIIFDHFEYIASKWTEYFNYF